MRIRSKKNREIYCYEDNGKVVPRLKGSWTNIYCHYKRPDYSIGCVSGKRDDVIDYINKTHLVEWYTTKLMKRFEDDEIVREYVQEIWLQILEQSDEKWEDLYRQGDAAITAFVSGIIIRNCISKTSKAYTTVHKWENRNIHLDSEIWDSFSETGEIKFNDNNISNEIDQYEQV